VGAGAGASGGVGAGGLGASGGLGVGAGGLGASGGLGVGAGSAADPTGGLAGAGASGQGSSAGSGAASSGAAANGASSASGASGGAGSAAAGSGGRANTGTPVGAFMSSPVFSRVAATVPTTITVTPLTATRLGVPCQTVTQTIEIGGQNIHAAAVLCRQSDGTWQIQPSQNARGGGETAPPRRLKGG
jgi:hypothetical protein